MKFVWLHCTCMSSTKLFTAINKSAIKLAEVGRLSGGFYNLGISSKDLGKSRVANLGWYNTMPSFRF